MFSRLYVTKLKKKISTRKGDNSKKSQRHKNTTAFKHNRNSKLTKIILNLPVQGVCERCREIIEWRKQYRKYKPLSVPKKCSVKCEEKKVKEAYHVACLDCSIKLEICAKCLERFEQNELLEEDSVIPLNFECSLKERDKRSFLRQKEKITSEEELKELVEKFQKKTSLDGLDEDDFDDFTDDEE
ncbi:hypothetical protein ROZALSC1DRAFT_20505 [Rozella allomycis CSF55]|uniref:DUF2039 domain-containing protein n=1 Tax=Rozella allomycis (strain CSF55) TaxID=988480 RepID=A0A4P9YPC1_ROZAC|nr:hypothetical protein ROZALSC1DRAFT_20505 [Rozella allomycis CSF55]